MNTLLQLFDGCLHQEYREEANSASWAVGREGDRLFLWFQHSHGVTDWLNNLKFYAVPYRDMNPEWTCHAGFLSVWKQLEPLISTEIADPTIRYVTLTGYSHGAALAVLCHEYIWFRRPDLRERLYGFGFGCPRVLYGCVPSEIARRWEQFYVIRNIDDLVTHLPPSQLGFCHVGNLITIGEPGLYSDLDAHRPENYRRELLKQPDSQVFLDSLGLL